VQPLLVLCSNFSATCQAGQEQERAGGWGGVSARKGKLNHCRPDVQPRMRRALPATGQRQLDSNGHYCRKESALSRQPVEL
jgi:hypothetical protein